MKSYLKNQSNLLKNLNIINEETNKIRNLSSNDLIELIEKNTCKLAIQKIYEFAKNPKCKMVDLLLRFTNEKTDLIKTSNVNFKTGLNTINCLSVTFISSIMFYYKYEIVRNIVDDLYRCDIDEDNLPPKKWYIDLFRKYKIDYYGAVNKIETSSNTIYTYKKCKTILKLICNFNPEILTKFSSKDMYYFTKYKIVEESVHTDNINFLNYNLKYSKTFEFKESTILYLEKFLEYENEINDDSVIERKYNEIAIKIFRVMFE